MPARMELVGGGAPESWERASELIKSDPEMEEAAGYFRRVLGAKFWEKRGELARRFLFRLQGGPPEWVRLHRLIRQLDDVPNVDTLIVRQLLAKTDWEQYVAGQQALEFCGRLHAAGHQIEILEQYERENEEDRTTPDVRVWLADRPVVVEFKALQAPPEQKQWDRLFSDAMTALVLARLDASVLDVDLRAPALRDQQVVIDALVDIAKRGVGGLVELPNASGTATFVGPRQQYPAWTIPIQQRDDVDRVRSKLRSDWVHQLLNVHEPTLVVALTEDAFAYRDAAYLQNDISRLYEMLAEVFPRRKMLGALLLHEESLLPPWQHRTVLVGEDARFIRDCRDGHDRVIFLMPNPDARIPLTQAELESLAGPAMKW